MDWFLVDAIFVSIFVIAIGFLVIFGLCMLAAMGYWGTLLFLTIGVPLIWFAIRARFKLY